MEDPAFPVDAAITVESPSSFARADTTPLALSLKE